MGISCLLKKTNETTPLYLWVFSYIRILTSSTNSIHYFNFMDHEQQSSWPPFVLAALPMSFVIINGDVLY